MELQQHNEDLVSDPEIADFFKYYAQSSITSDLIYYSMSSSISKSYVVEEGEDGESKVIKKTTGLILSLPNMLYSSVEDNEIVRTYERSDFNVPVVNAELYFTVCYDFARHMALMLLFGDGYLEYAMPLDDETEEMIYDMTVQNMDDVMNRMLNYLVNDWMKKGYCFAISHEEITVDNIETYLDSDSVINPLTKSVW